MSPEIRQMKGRKMQSERVFRNVKKIGLKIGSDQANHLIIIKLCYNFSIKTGRYSIFWGRKERYRKLKTNSSKVGWVVAELQKF